MYLLREDGIVAAVGQDLADLLGYAVDEMVGRHYLDFVSHDYLLTSQRQFDRKARERAPVTEEVTELVSRDGRPILFAIRSFRLQQANGEALLVGVAAQVRNANLLELTSDAAAIGIADDMRVVGWNAAAARLTGRSADAALGRPCWEVLGLAEDSGEPLCRQNCRLVESMRTSGEAAPVYVRAPTPAGERRRRLSTLSAELGAGRFLVHLLPSGNGGRSEAGSPLTARQQEILALLDQGLTTAEIARQLVLTKTTVRNHVQAILRTLGCHSRLEAVAEGRRLGFL